MMLISDMGQGCLMGLSRRQVGSGKEVEATEGIWEGNRLGEQLQVVLCEADSSTDVSSGPPYGVWKLALFWPCPLAPSYIPAPLYLFPSLLLPVLLFGDPSFLSSLWVPILQVSVTTDLGISTPNILGRRSFVFFPFYR